MLRGALTLWELSYKSPVVMCSYFWFSSVGKLLSVFTPIQILGGTRGAGCDSSSLNARSLVKIVSQSVTPVMALVVASKVWLLLVVAWG